MSAAPLRQSRPVSASQPSRSRGASSAPAPRRHLHAVAAPEQARSLAPLAIACVAIVLAALASVLLINTQMTQGAFERRDLKIEIASLHQQQAALVSELESFSAPNYLASAAEELGMVPASASGFISIEDSTVLHQGD
ncbi:hypothetical protein [Demequina globuliformis]|uniref:hypothetical protein n=1 Tax=Demequina globuliformis TaxID=676202 RepID=UPI000B1E3D79|nr:hypothetical protein [Demequina globuliformis]